MEARSEIGPGTTADLLALPVPDLRARLDRAVAELLAAGADCRRRENVLDLLDLVRLPAVLRRIERGEREAWAAAILRAVDAAHYTVGPLFRRRAEQYGPRVLFELAAESWTWQRARQRADALARGFLALALPGQVPRVALLSENRLELALCDLACLGAGIVDVLVPANATDADVGYVLRHSRATIVVVEGGENLRKVLHAREQLAELSRIVCLDPPRRPGSGVLSLDDLLRAGERIPAEEPRRRGEATDVADLATVMYTSGTTGTPKGICFSQRNLVFKRFARALALPEIGDQDTLACFLPLYHTFGRFLELLGSVFWGARYCFLDSTAPEGLVQGLTRYRPSVFISVPKKWSQLHELIVARADPLSATDAELYAALRQVTGGRLRWGLSAAGWLDPEVFRFFQHQGVELLSGFGMTEATGGITMTPPGEYRDGSLGVPLPGIECRLDAEGELAVRGPYVMLGYLDPPDGESGFDAEGFLRTGDLMELDAAGHMRLVDRKKEIYKNVKGETIAPQRVENLFRDFESVGRVFLVGDHREYNTLLIWPRPGGRDADLTAIGAAERREHFRSLVVSVNRFLARYERIVDFALMDRDLDPARGELTPKGTPRRKTVEHNFADVIAGLYHRTTVHAGGIELVVPNWLFQILGLTAHDVAVDAAGLALPGGGARLTVAARDAATVRLGSCIYRHGGGPLNLGTLLTTPSLWLGNEELVAFAPLDTVTRQRPGRRRDDLTWAGRAAPYVPADEERARLAACLGRPDLDLLDLDLAARALAVADEATAVAAGAVVAQVLSAGDASLADAARSVLGRVAEEGPRPLRRIALCGLFAAEREERLRQTLERFVDHDPDLLDLATRQALARHALSESQQIGLVELAASRCFRSDGGARGDRVACALLGLVAEWGAAHPTSYRRLRSFLVRARLFAPRLRVRARAARALARLERGLREWLGGASRVAVDPDTGREFGWADVTVFDPDVPAADRERLAAALSRTALLSEAVFLFGGGHSIRLSDLAPGGLRVRSLGALHGKSVYRLTAQTRLQGTFELAVNVNHDLAPHEVQEEVQWLIVGAEPGPREALVEEFGGYWSAHDLWSEAFSAGERLDRELERLARLPGGEERLRRLWPFMAWAALSAYVDFWHRSGRRLELDEPGPEDVIVPAEDFLSGLRLVSLSRRRPHAGLLAMLHGFHERFVTPVERRHAVLAGRVDWTVIVSALLEVLGQDEGLRLLHQALDDAAQQPAGPAGAPELRTELARVAHRFAADGFVPMRLHFAIERYRRWAALNADSTPQARARMLAELDETYGLRHLASRYPEARARLFLETVFGGAGAPWIGDLRELVAALRERRLAPEGLIDAVDGLRARHDLARDDEYFLARMSYPYLRPQDEADFVTADLGGRRLGEIVVALEDREGNAYRVRHALNPREVERLFRLFLAARLSVRFRMEHRYLVAINERGQIIGGIYYEIDDASNSAHLEKIVVAPRYRGAGVADGLLHEFLNRLRAAGVRAVTTGFFLPEYFAGHGFRVDHRYAGVVRMLDDASAGTP